MATFHEHQHVRSSALYASQFPLHIRQNGGRPLRGRVRRITRDGLVVVKFAELQTELRLAPQFVEPDGGSKNEPR